MSYFKRNFDSSNSERPDFTADMTARQCVALKMFRLENGIKKTVPSKIYVLKNLTILIIILRIE